LLCQQRTNHERDLRETQTDDDVHRRCMIPLLRNIM
jgi:hypothetical protein